MIFKRTFKGLPGVSQSAAFSLHISIYQPISLPLQVPLCVYVYRSVRLCVHAFVWVDVHLSLFVPVVDL